MVTGVKARRQNHHPRWRQDKQLPGMMQTNLVVSAAKSRRHFWEKPFFCRSSLEQYDWHPILQKSALNAMFLTKHAIVCILIVVSLKSLSPHHGEDRKMEFLK